MSQLPRICRDFSIVYIVLAGLMLALARAMDALDLEISGIAASVPLLVAALAAGSRFAARDGRMPPSALSWRAAIWAALCAIAISLAVLGVATLIVGAPARAELRELLSKPQEVAIILAVLIPVFVLAIRILFPMGARAHLGAGPGD